MRVYIAGQGEREKYLAQLCAERGHAVTQDGPWDMIVLNIPKSVLSGPLSDQLPFGQKIVCGKTDQSLENEVQQRGWKLLRVLEDEAYTQANAELTAEGALCAAMTKAPVCLNGAKCLVIGYGRIGKALTKRLRALGAETTVAARREESRREAGNGIPIEDIPSVLPETQFVFNTVPAPILTENVLKHAKQTGSFFELASFPYGIDLDAARQLGLNAYLESGIPGRYFPQSAAELLLRYMEREADHHE